MDCGRSSRPLSSPRQTAPATCAVIATLRRQRHTGQQIAAAVGVSAATVSRILRRLRLNRIRDLEPAEPVRRYERAAPGEMIYIDIKKLERFSRIGRRITGVRTGYSHCRGLGWEFVHVCIEDHSRVAFSEIRPDQSAESAVAFLKAAVAYYKSLGVAVTRVMTGNGGCYLGFAFRDACRDLGLKHIRTKPYTPQTNGKAERFIQTSLKNAALAGYGRTLVASSSPTASTFCSSMKRSGRQPTGFRLRMSGWSISSSHSNRRTPFAGAWW
jgi:transposase InsO family protein